MKRNLIVLLGFLLTLGAVAQEGTPIPYRPQSKPFPIIVNLEPWRFQGPYYDGIYYQNRNDRYEAVRIGEYYWMTTNLRNQKTYSDSSDANQGNVDDALRSIGANLDQYQGIEEKIDPLNPNAEIKYGMFDYYYGRYYHMMNLNGYKRPGWDHESFDEAARIYYGDNVNTKKGSSGWAVARAEAYKQLFATCNVSSSSYRLLASDIIKQLAALPNDAAAAQSSPWLTNPLAYDLKSAESSDKYVTNWFRGATNNFGFNLMPNGKRYHWDSNYFIDLFKYANFAWYRGSLDLSEKITFYPIDPANASRPIEYADGGADLEGFTWNNRYSARMARALTPQELGYEIWYIPGTNQYGDIVQKGMPDFRNPYLKITQNVDGKVVKPEKPSGSNLDWEVLPHGYLRGFYSQYEVYNTAVRDQRNYQLVDYVKMARCVQDTWAMQVLEATKYDRDIEPCDCEDVQNTPYLADHLKMDAYEDYHYFENARGKEFRIYALNNNPSKVAIGLFKATKIPTEKLNLEETISYGYDASTNEYLCKIGQKPSLTSGYIIQAYMIDEDGKVAKDKDGNIITIKRPTNKPEIIDRLPFTLKKNYSNVSTYASASPTEDVLLGNISIVRTGKGDIQSNFAVEAGGQFVIQLTGVEIPLADVEIALLLESGGEFVDQISIKKNTSKNQILCEIPAGVSGGESYVLSAYTGNPYDDSFKLLSRTSDLLYIDRLPLYVEINNDWGFEWDSFSTLKSLDLISDQTVGFNVAFNYLSSLLSISIDKGTATNLSVYSIAGNRVLNLSNPASEVSLSTIPSGAYIVKVVSDNNETKSIKIVKQ